MTSARTWTFAETFFTSAAAWFMLKSNAGSTQLFPTVRSKTFFSMCAIPSKGTFMYVIATQSRTSPQNRKTSKKCGRKRSQKFRRQRERKTETSPFVAFPITIQQSSCESCAATSFVVYSFSVFGSPMVLWTTLRFFVV